MKKDNWNKVLEALDDAMAEEKNFDEDVSSENMRFAKKMEKANSARQVSEAVKEYEQNMERIRIQHEKKMKLLTQKLKALS